MTLLPKNTLNTPSVKTDQNNTIFIGKVVSLSDDIFDDHRIKVRLKGIDPQSVLDRDLVFCDPFLPKHLNIIPKIGEWVKILFWNTNNKQQNREYIGPIISQPQKLKKDTSTSFSTKSLSLISPETSKEVLADAKGIYPEKEDIAIQGRDNTSIIQREKEVVIRAGIHQVDDNLKLNKGNPSFIHQKISNDGKLSNTNIVANKINLITHNGSPTLRTLTGVKGEDIIDLYSGKISDKVQEQINKNTHSIPYGDKLVELLKLIIKFLEKHSHPASGESPSKDARGGLNDDLEKILKFDLNEGSFRSKNIKIN